MVIACDLRSLSGDPYSGVGEYGNQLLRFLIPLGEKEHDFIFFTSGIHSSATKTARHLADELSVPLRVFKIPNKLLHSSLYITGKPAIDRLVGGADIVFSPNLHFLGVSKRTKLVLTVHDLSFDHFPHFFSNRRKLWHGMIRPGHLFSRADRLIAVSEFTRQDLCQRYRVPPEKVSVVHSGISDEYRPGTAAAQVRKRYQLPDKYILSLSTLEPRKNISGLLKAYASLAKSDPSFPYDLVIAGKKGWLYEEMFALAKSLGLGKRVRWLGFVRGEDKKHIYRSASLFVYPSFYEGFGFPPLEAMACGVPTVVSTAGSLPEVTGDGALHVDPHDVGQLAAVIDTALVDSELRARLREKGKEQASKYNWDKAARETLRVFEEVV